MRGFIAILSKLNTYAVLSMQDLRRFFKMREGSF